MVVVVAVANARLVAERVEPLEARLLCLIVVEEQGVWDQPRE